MCVYEIHPLYIGFYFRAMRQMATELGGSAVTSQDTLGASDIMSMAPLFLPHSLRNFLLCQPVGIVCALYLLNAKLQPRKQRAPFKKSLWYDSAGV